jgi:hypothetical protein
MVLSKRPLVKNTKSAKTSMQQRSLVLFDSAIKQLFDEYQKVIPELMIEDKFRLLKQIEKKDEKINELNQNDNEIDMFKHTILEIQNNLLEMRNMIKN